MQQSLTGVSTLCPESLDSFILARVDQGFIQCPGLGLVSGGFPKLGVPFWGSPIIVFGVYIGVPNFGKLLYEAEGCFFDPVLNKLT